MLVRCWISGSQARVRLTVGEVTDLWPGVRLVVEPLLNFLLNLAIFTSTNELIFSSQLTTSRIKISLSLHSIHSEWLFSQLQILGIISHFHSVILGNLSCLPTHNIKNWYLCFIIQSDILLSCRMSLHFYTVKTSLPSWQDDVRSEEEKEIVLVFSGRGCRGCRGWEWSQWWQAVSQPWLSCLQSLQTPPSSSDRLSWPSSCLGQTVKVIDRKMTARPGSRLLPD